MGFFVGPDVHLTGEFIPLQGRNAVWQASFLF